MVIRFPFWLNLERLAAFALPAARRGEAVPVRQHPGGGEETPPERNQSGVILLGNVDQIALFRDAEIRESFIKVTCGQRGTIQLGLAGGVIDIMSFQDRAQGGVGVNGVGVAVQVIDDRDVNHGENLLMMKYFCVGMWIVDEKSWPGVLVGVSAGRFGY